MTTQKRIALMDDTIDLIEKSKLDDTSLMAVMSSILSGIIMRSEYTM